MSNLNSAEKSLDYSPVPKFKSIFAKSTAKQRKQNFEDYWEFSKNHSGRLYEQDKDLEQKRKKLKYFQQNKVRSRKPLKNPELFYRNYVDLKDKVSEFDEKTLTLTCIYKFARHEWVGISGAWDAVPSLSEAKILTDKISRVHLAEEFCHVRYFHEMFRVFHLEEVKWVPLGPVMQKVYAFFPRVPEVFMAPLAFVTELMGISFYRHLDSRLDSIFSDEPEARQRIRELLHEIMVDELAHIGQRRNYLGPIGIKMSEWMVSPLFRMFFRDIPEAKHLFDIDQMIKDAQEFNYSGVDPHLMNRTWVPSYLYA